MPKTNAEKVCVLSKTGQPIMPTGDYRKVRRLLQAGKAKMVKANPFTIQLLTTSKTYTQDISARVGVGGDSLTVEAVTAQGAVFQHNYPSKKKNVAKGSARSEAPRPKWLTPKGEVILREYIKRLKKVKKRIPLTALREDGIQIDQAFLEAAIVKEFAIEALEGRYKALYPLSSKESARALWLGDYTCRLCGEKKDVMELGVGRLKKKVGKYEQLGKPFVICKRCQAESNGKHIHLQPLQWWAHPELPGLITPRVLRYLRRNADIPILSDDELLDREEKARAASAKTQEKSKETPATATETKAEVKAPAKEAQKAMNYDISKAQKDIQAYLDGCGKKWFQARRTSKEKILGNKALMERMAKEHIQNMATTMAGPQTSAKTVCDEYMTEMPEFK